MKEMIKDDAQSVQAWISAHTGICAPLRARITEEQCRFNRSNSDGPKQCLACKGMGNAAQEAVKRAVKRQRHVFLPEGKVCISDIMLAIGHSRTAIAYVVKKGKKGIRVESEIAESVRNFLALRGMNFDSIINPQKIRQEKNNARRKAH